MIILSLAAALSAGSIGLDDPAPRASPWLGEVSKDRLIADVRALEGFGTRHLLSGNADPTRGIDAAGEWIKRSRAARPLKPAAAARL